MIFTMKKILLAIDAAHTEVQIVNFACYIAALTQSSVTGIFFENNEETVPVMKMAFGMPYVESIVAGDMPDYDARHEIRDENIRRFEKACESNGVRCQIQVNGTNTPAKTIIEESRFADLVIVNAGTSFEKKFEGAPTSFVKEVLAGAECPVLAAPLTFTGIDQIVFAYDGSPSSVFAIKQFAYLFPELTDKKAIVLQVNKQETMPLKEKEKIGELLKMHYSGIGFQVLQGKPSDELFEFLFDKKNTIVVMGAFGRSWLSGLLRPSSAGLLLKTMNLPFFITHY
jgi:nucleotide-binding universal stress UspA family protein